MMTIELSTEEASLFVDFRKYQDTFTLLQQSGVFNVRNGQAVLSFDHQGILQQVEFNVIGYKRGKPLLRVINMT